MRVVALAVAAYAVLIVSLATVPPGGIDWTPLALLAVAHLGLGWAIARTWALLLPVALSSGIFVIAGASELDWLILFVALPVAAAVTGVGLLLGRRSDRGRPSRSASPRSRSSPRPRRCSGGHRGPHVPASVQRELPANTVHYSHGDQDRREITIRDLAEDQPSELESGGPECAPELERRIRAAMES